MILRTCLKKPNKKWMEISLDRAGAKSNQEWETVAKEFRTPW
jgi:hypothetical protein